MRTRLDTDRPRLACDAPWRITSKPIHIAEQAEPIKWTDVEGNCSAECFRQNLDRYNDGLTKQAERGRAS